MTQSPNDQTSPRGAEPPDSPVPAQMIAEERQARRRELFWFGAVLVLLLLLAFALFAAVGVSSLRGVRRASLAAYDADGRVAALASQVIGAGARIDRIEAKQVELRAATEDCRRAILREGEALCTEIEQLRRAADARRQTEGNAMATMATQLKDLVDAADRRETEMAMLKDECADAAAAALAAAASAKSASAAHKKRGLSEGPKPPRELVVAEAPGPGPSVEPTEAYPEGTTVVEAGEDDDQSAEGEEGAAVREISVVTFPNGDRYEGEFKDGLFHGQGTYIYANGTRYDGDFEYDMKQGRGVMRFANGDRYTGEFRNDMMHGKGSLVYANRNKYVGEMRNGVRHGKGVLTFPNGDRYEGEYQDDLRHGQGTYLFHDGSKYIGEFARGKRHGKGRYIYAGEGEYVGEFKDGRKHGYGECTYPSGEHLKGYWSEDKFERAVP